MTLTFALPVLEFNKFLKNTLEGIRALHGLHNLEHEIILVQNGEKKSVPDWVREVPHLRVIHQPQPHIARARNRALNEARGEFIAFIDDDSYLPQHWLAEAFSYFQSPFMAAFTSPTKIFCKSVFSGVPVTIKMDFRNNFKQGIIHNMVPFDTGACMFRTSVLREIGGFETLLKRNEDMEIATRLFRQGWMLSYGETLVEGYETVSLWGALKKTLSTYYYYKYFLLMYGIDHKVKLYNSRKFEWFAHYDLIQALAMKFLQPQVQKFALPDRRQFAVFIQLQNGKVLVPKHRLQVVFLGQKLGLVLGGSKVLQTSCFYLSELFKKAQREVTIQVSNITDDHIQAALLHSI